MKEDWIEIELGDIAYIYNGNSINARIKKERYETCKKGLNYIGTKDVGFDTIINYQNGVIIPFNEPKFKTAPKGAVLVCSEGGSAGRKVGFTDEEVCFGNKLFAITNEYSAFEGKYVFYYTRYRGFFQAFQNQMNGIIGGVSAKKFSTIPIPLAPLPIQRAIVSKIESLFSDLDNGIANLKKAQEQLKIYRQAVLKKAFEGGFTHNIENKEQLPSGWNIIALGDIIDSIEAGKSFRCEERPPYENEVGILKVSAVTWGNFLEDESKTVTDESRINPNYFVKGGDFILSRANTLELVGNSVIVNSISKTLMLSDKTLRINFAKDVSKKYILYFLRTRQGRNQIEKLATGNQVSMRNIGQARIKQIECPLPKTLPEQQQIVQEIESRLSVCDKMEQSIAESLEKSNALRQSILKKAFEGKLLSEAEIVACKQEADYEPAPVLLEKIKAEKFAKEQEAKKTKKKSRK